MRATLETPTIHVTCAVGYGDFVAQIQTPVFDGQEYVAIRQQRDFAEAALLARHPAAIVTAGSSNGSASYLLWFTEVRHL